MSQSKSARLSCIVVAITACLAAPAAFPKAIDAGSRTPLAQGASHQDQKVRSSDSRTRQHVTKLQAISVVGHFLSNASESAMKLNVPVRDTPFSVSTYTGAFMHAIEAHSIATLYPYMTGIQSAGITGYDLTFRGFTSGANDFNSILVDGLPGLATRFGSPVTIGISHVDVVRGPASALNGQEQPGGFINLITKKPEAEPFYELSASTTTYDGAGVGITDAPGLDLAADLTGPINSNKSLLYRVIMDDSNRDTFRNSSYDRSIYFAPSVIWNISDATSLTAAYVYQRLHYSYDTYLVAPDSNINLVAPITTRYQEPGDNEREHGSVLTLMLKHQFASGATWNVDTRDVWHTDTAAGLDVYVIRPDLLHVGRRARRQLNKRRNDFIDTNLQMPLTLFGMKNQMVVGMTAGRDGLNANRQQFFEAPATGPDSLDISIYDPVYYRAPPLSRLPLGSGKSLNSRVTATHTFGAYFNDLISLGEQWKANVGVRYARDQQTFDETFPLVPKDAVHNSKTNSKVLPMAGLVYQPNEHWSDYISYSTSYVPPAAQYVNIDGVNDFTPTSARQVEIGTKTNWLDGRLNATIALYQIKESNTFSHFNCKVFGTCYEQVGGAHSRGAEFEVNLHPIPNWQILAGLAYTNARITASSNSVQIGTRLPDVPLNSEHVWSRYDFTTPALEGLGFGVGIIHEGQREGVTPTKAHEAVLSLPAYTRVDAAVYYNYKQFAFTLKVENLFDAKYYQSAGFNGDINLLPGVPRMITLSARVFLQ